MPSPESRLAAILSADVVGYSRLMAGDEEATIRAITARREEVELHVQQHRGRVVDFTGDNFLVEFGSAVEALECGGTAYNVVERVYALYPQESGTIDVSPARFEARVLRNGRITGRKVYESEPLTIDVQPIPAFPAEFSNAVWLPAREVTISEECSSMDAGGDV